MTRVMVALVALDVVLVGVAIRSNDKSAVDPRPLASVLPIRSTAAAPTPPPVQSALPSTPATQPGMRSPAVPLQTMLVGVDLQRAWRVVTGSCASGGATVAATTNGGKTWSTTQTPLRTIVRVRAGDNKAAFVIGANTSCEPQRHNTTDAGATWGAATSAASAWFRKPNDYAVVASPGPSMSKPCDNRAVVDLAVLSTDSAQVLCADGQVRSTTNKASTWNDSGKAIGAVALAVRSADPGKTYVALLGAPNCAGVQVRQVGQADDASCIVTPLPEGGGQIALSLVKDGGWLAVGSKTMRSTDGLVSWTAS